MTPREIFVDDSLINHGFDVVVTEEFGGVSVFFRNTDIERLIGRMDNSEF